MISEKLLKFLETNNLAEIILKNAKKELAKEQKVLQSIIANKNSGTCDYLNCKASIESYKNTLKTESN